MKMRRRFLLVVLIPAWLSCMLPGMIRSRLEQKGPMPSMEKDEQKMLDVLKGNHWLPLQALTSEQYTDEEYARPGTLKYTATITNDLPIYFSYGWCAVDEATLKQNFEHIHVTLYINGTEFPADTVHQLNFTGSGNLQCLDHGVLLSGWADGSYTLKSVATFEETINDGLKEYPAGDYVFEYNVVVKKAREGAFAPSGLIDKTVFQ